MLEDPLTGNNRFSSEDIYVSNYMNSRQNTTDYVDVISVNQADTGSNSKIDYLYSYYVSRYFTVQENVKGTSVSRFDYAGKTIYDLIKTSDIQEIIMKDNLIDINDIYITNQDGALYVDSTGRKKYRIILEKYTDKFVSSIETLCKIIVLLEDPNPTGLVLNYNKIELTTDGFLVNAISNFKENINAVSLFNRESEESLVVDYSSKHDRTYAVKSSEKIEDMFSIGGSFDSRGYNFYVNKKAIPDNRNYEVFNWRLIGKINRSFDYANRIDGGTNGSGGIVNVGVIKANTKEDYIDHYKIFKKLDVENNPINIYNYKFENPQSKADGLQKDDSNYWIADLETISHDQVKKFDFLVLVVNSNTDIYSIIPKIKSFTDNGGCLFVEVEGAVSDSVKSILPAPVGSLITGAATSITYNRTSENEYSDLNLFAKNQTWDIQSSIFDTGYGAYGKIAQNITAFDSGLSTYQTLSTNIGPVFLQFRTNVIDSGSVSCGNILMNTVSINKKAGADYLPNTQTVTGTTNSRQMIVTSDAEGPLKYFYNSLLVGLISKYYTTSNSSNSFSSTLLTPVLFHATKWYTSWALNGPTTDDNYSYNDILIKNDIIDEYAEYGFTKEQNGDLYRKLSDRTVKELFIQDFSASVPNDYGQFYNSNDSITYYIEFTNSTIIPKNGTYLPNSITSGITTPYKTFELSSSQAEQTQYVKTTTISRPLNVPSNFGLFYIKDRFRDITNIRNNQPNIVNDNPYSYSYDFKTSWKKVVSQESSLSFDLSFDVSFTIQIPITIEQWEKKWEQIGWKPADSSRPIDAKLSFVSGNYDSSGASTANIPLSKIGKNITNKYFCREDFIDYSTIHNPNVADRSLNHYPYTGDIDLGNSPKQYSVGPRSGDLDSGTYVHYIQWTMKKDGYNVSTDGKLGPQTGGALTSFQRKYGLATVDQQVDSETKSAMAYFWGTKKQKKQLAAIKKEITTYYAGINKTSIGNKVIEYIDAAITNADPVYVTESGSIKRISYTGSAKTPGTIVSNVFISLPDDVINRAENGDIFNIKIKTGICGLVVEDVKFYKTETNESNLSRFPQQGGLDRLSGSSIDIPANTEREITVDFTSNPSSPYKFLFLKLRGKKLPANYGTGQGIFVDYITVNYMPDPGAQEPDYGWKTYGKGSLDVTGYLDVVSTVQSNNLTIANTPKQQKITSTTYHSLPMTVEDFYYVDQNGARNTFTYSSGSNQITAGTTLNLNSVFDLTIDTGSNEWGTMKLNFDKSSVAKSSSVSISNKKVGISGQALSTQSAYIDYIDLDSSSKDLTGASEFEVTYDVNVNSISSDIIYGGETTVGQHRHLYASYLAKDQSKTSRVSPIDKNSVDYLSGIVCLCDTEGNPVGKPNFQLASNSNDSVSVNITNIYLEKNSNFPEEGLVYGFYDLAAKKFLGKNISYSEYIERNGDNNIYIAVLATDYDGNVLSDDLDFTGFSTIPVSIARVPNRVICPIYSVKFKNKASIEVFKPQNFLDKKTPWYVGVSSGSFVRSLNVDVKNIYNQDISWLKKYATGQSSKVELKAYYDTENYGSSGWSKILRSTIF